MVNKPRTVEVEERFNAVVEEFGALLRRAIVRLCPHDKGLQFDDGPRGGDWSSLLVVGELELQMEYAFGVFDLSLSD